MIAAVSSLRTTTSPALLVCSNHNQKGLSPRTEQISFSAPKRLNASRIIETSRTLIIMLTAKDQLSYKVDAFDVGADDYLAKSFSLKELKIRINAIAR